METTIEINEKMRMIISKMTPIVKVEHIKIKNGRTIVRGHILFDSRKIDPEQARQELAEAGNWKEFVGKNNLEVFIGA